jgi:hypothetical protein
MISPFLHFGVGRFSSCKIKRRWLCRKYSLPVSFPNSRIHVAALAAQQVRSPEHSCNEFSPVVYRVHRIVGYSNSDGSCRWRVGTVYRRPWTRCRAVRLRLPLRLDGGDGGGGGGELSWGGVPALGQACLYLGSAAERTRSERRAAPARGAAGRPSQRARWDGRGGAGGVSHHRPDSLQAPLQQRWQGEGER